MCVAVRSSLVTLPSSTCMPSHRISGQAVHTSFSLIQSGLGWPVPSNANPNASLNRSLLHHFERGQMERGSEVKQPTSLYTTQWSLASIRATTLHSMCATPSARMGAPQSAAFHLTPERGRDGWSSVRVTVRFLHH